MANIFSDIFKFAGTAINQALTPDNLRDQRHASKLFVDDQYRLLPKMGYLFHVFFDINPNAALPDPQNPNNIKEIGMLVKSVSLPKFTVDTKKYNAYNRPNYAQTRINYDPINIVFHDDSADVIRNFWFDYYNYYFRDADYNESLYGKEHKYEAVRQSDKWGFTPRVNSGPSYLKSIRIYSLHQKRFSEYVLLNPIIKSFRHGDHQAGSNELVQHDMTIEYESVLYYYGSTSSQTVKGFADLHYDKMPSPLTPAGGGTKSILGPGGLMDTADDVIHDIKDGNYGSALFKGLKGLKSASSMDLKKAAIGEVLAIGTGVLRGNNPQNNIFVPSLPSLGGALSDIGGRFGIGSLVSGGGIGGGSWLAGAAGLGILSLGGGAGRNQEMSDATSFLEGQAPYSSYFDLPAPDGSDVEVDGYNTSDYYSGDDSLNTIDFDSPATNQGTMFDYGEIQDLDNNIAIGTAGLNDLDVEANQLKEQQQLTIDAIDAMDAKKQDMLAMGYTENDPEIQELNQQIDMQIAVVGDQDSKLNDLSERSSSLALELERQIVRKEGLTGVGGI